MTALLAHALLGWHRLFPRGALAFAAGCALVTLSALVLASAELSAIPD
jgi:hypothetical protein